MAKLGLQQVLHLFKEALWLLIAYRLILSSSSCSIGVERSSVCLLLSALGRSPSHKERLKDSAQLSHAFKLLHSLSHERKTSPLSFRLHTGLYAS